MGLGHLITLEGGEGAGKSTQMRHMEAWLHDKGYNVLTTREPGGTPGAEAVRHAVLSGGAKQYGTIAEAILFAAARADNVQNVIRPALEAGKVVICDRYLDSSRVYQGVTGGVPSEILEPLQRAVTEGGTPNLTLIFDIDPVEGLKRAAKVWAEDGPDRYEQDKLDQQHARRQAFLDIAAQEPHRCVVIDASASEEQVRVAVQNALSAYFERSEAA